MFGFSWLQLMFDCNIAKVTEDNLNLTMSQKDFFDNTVTTTRHAAVIQHIVLEFKNSSFLFSYLYADAIKTSIYKTNLY